MKYIKINEHDVNIDAIESVSDIKEEVDVQLLPTYNFHETPTGRFYFKVRTISGNEFYEFYCSSTEASIKRQEFMEKIKWKA